MHIKQLTADEKQRSFVVVLDEGEEAAEQLLTFSRRHHVIGATFTGLGAFSKATLGFFEMDRKDYHHIEIAEQVELISMVGNFADQNGTPRLHCHVSVSNRNGNAFGGHLLKGYVRPTLEVMVFDTPLHLRRATDARTGLPLLVP